MAGVSNSPLLGDGQGCYKVLVIGNSGTGKSTLSAALAQKLGVTYIALDKLNWNPGWQEAPAAELMTRVRKALENNPQGWVTDGSYTRKISTLVQDEATDIIWLDPPLLLYYPRILLRTLQRLFGLAEPCSPGCPEDFFQAFLSRDGILWWCLSHHYQVRRRCQEMMSRIGLGMGSNVERRRMRRIGGWGEELRKWWRNVELLVEKKTL